MQFFKVIECQMNKFVLTKHLFFSIAPLGKIFPH